MPPPPPKPVSASRRLRLAELHVLVALAAAPLAILAVFARQPEISPRGSLLALLGISAAGGCLAMSWHASRIAFHLPAGAPRAVLELASMILGGAAFVATILLYFLCAWVGAFTVLWLIAILCFLVYRE